MKLTAIAISTASFCRSSFMSALLIMTRFPDWDTATVGFRSSELGFTTRAPVTLFFVSSLMAFVVLSQWNFFSVFICFMLLLIKSWAIRNGRDVSRYERFKGLVVFFISSFLLLFGHCLCFREGYQSLLFTFPYVVVSSVARNFFSTPSPLVNFSFLNFLIFNFVPHVK